MKRALIIGSEGQDGRLLFDRLDRENITVLGLGRQSARSNRCDRVEAVDISSHEAARRLVREWKPDAIFHLAAVHQSSQGNLARDDAALFAASQRVHVDALLNFLDALRGTNIRLLYAASSLVFGMPPAEVQDESTPIAPRCIYGITKAAGIHLCRFFRESHGVHASAGILYNHESPLRAEDFVSQKIIRTALAIAHGEKRKLVLGDLSARVDWGYAPDFIDAILRIIQRPQGDDYIVATGDAHTVQEFVEAVFGTLGLDWRKHVEEDRALLTRPPVTRIGNATKLRRATGWQPSVTFSGMVQALLRS